MAIYKKDYKKNIHIRHHDIKQHNTIIVGEDKFNYDFVVITHAPKRDKTHKNIEFTKNPNPKQKDKSYFEKKIRIDKKDNFAKYRNKTWIISDKDFTKIINFLNDKKK